MEGFLRISLPPWQRRMLTRVVAMVPAAIVAGVAGNRGAGKLLVLSQVIGRSWWDRGISMGEMCLAVHAATVAGDAGHRAARILWQVVGSVYSQSRSARISCSGWATIANHRQRLPNTMLLLDVATMLPGRCSPSEGA